MTLARTALLGECIDRLGCRVDRPETLPFSLNDTTAGSETELQVAVLGKADCVDLPNSIRTSNYFANVMRRAAAGDTSPRSVSKLLEYLQGDSDGVWENSWVRLPVRTLSPLARAVLDQDLRAEKANPLGAYRSDISSFCIMDRGEEFIRIPISYLVKLALADAIHDVPSDPSLIRFAGLQAMTHFLSDNTSPETSSLHVVSLLHPGDRGLALARETARRFLLTQLLVAYSNQRFELEATGQKAAIFFSPHPPTRQKFLNDCIADAYYRDLFMSPCLSGWDRGEDKRAYMSLCHQVLSRSHLNAVGKLREAGIITRNLVVLPNTSNISLANNGIHISLGSRRLQDLMTDPASGFTRTHEKFLGDLAIKIVEHFLPLFVGTYSAAPFRLDFGDFHPEVLLGFLPHELDFTHLRMFWRRWRRKTRNKIFGHSVTPFGLEWTDRALSSICRLQGDFIPDFRLIDYPVALMSTEKSPALDGEVDNLERLRKDLDDLGVFDRRMSSYMLYKLREFHRMNFSGFEARYYSLFPAFAGDMAQAVNLQQLLTCLAFKYIVSGKYTHEDIPDSPFIESERRQIFFGVAAGIPTFFVRRDTTNVLLRDILAETRNTRASRRYAGYMRVHNLEYRRALVRIISRDAADLIDLLGVQDTLDNLHARLEPGAGYSAAERLMTGILKDAGLQSPFARNSDYVNGAAERYYRTTLRQKHLFEALDLLEEDLEILESNTRLEADARKALASIYARHSPVSWLRSIRNALIAETASLVEIRQMILLILILEHVDSVQENAAEKPPVHRT